MTNWLSKTVSSGKTAFNIVKSIGPFLISQSEIVSDSYVKHQAKLASVEIGKELIIDEAKTLNDVRKQLLTKFTESNAEDRIRIKKDIEYIEGNLRQLNIGQKALSYLPPPKDKKTEDQTSPEIIPHWMDKFNELARVRNEPWREELLARALATEASSSGTIMPRALWLIGTLEEHLFHAWFIVVKFYLKKLAENYYVREWAAIKFVGAHNNFSARYKHNITHLNILFLALVIESVTLHILVFESLN